MKFQIALLLLFLSTLLVNTKAASTQKPGGTDEEEEEGNGEQEAEMIAKGVELYKELVAGLQESIMKLWRAEELTKIGQSLAELNVELETKQKEALKVIVQIHVDAMLAIDASRLVVTKLKNVCTSLILILDNLATDEGLKIAIETFLDEAKRLNADVDAAVLRLTTVSLASSKVDDSLSTLNLWAEEKKKKIKELSDSEISKERAKAYGGSAACVLAGPWAIFACPIAYSIASGITEGKNVKDIQEAFDFAINQINGMKADIKKIGDETKVLIDKVVSDKSQMVVIQGQLDVAQRNGRLALKLFDSFYTTFKASVNLLLDSCKAYLAREQNDDESVVFKLE